MSSLRVSIVSVTKGLVPPQVTSAFLVLIAALCLALLSGCDTAGTAYSPIPTPNPVTATPALTTGTASTVGTVGTVGTTATPSGEASPTKRPAASDTGTTLTVSAAAVLTPAFTELGKLFEESTGVKVVFNFGSTGQLAQQIDSGAPVDLFAAADKSYIDNLNKEGLVLSETVALYAQGRITLWTRSDIPLTFSTLQDLTQSGVKRIAIANPDHAPYGVAAREALQSAGLWDKLQPKLILGENVAQTLQYADSGNVDAAIVALSLSVATGKEGKWALIPAELHKPLNQALAVIKSSKHGAEARRFAAFINGPQGRPVMQKYGFVLPGEQPTR